MISLEFLGQLVGVGDGGELGAGGAVHVADAQLHARHLDLAQHRHVNVRRLPGRAESDLVQAILSLNLV